MKHRNAVRIFLAGAASAWGLCQLAVYALESRDAENIDHVEEGEMATQAEMRLSVVSNTLIQRPTSWNVTETFHVQYAGVAQGWDVDGDGDVDRISQTGAVVIVPADGESHCKNYLLINATSNPTPQYAQVNSSDIPWTPRAQLALALTAQVSGRRLRVFDSNGDCHLGDYDGSTGYYDSLMLSD